MISDQNLTDAIDKSPLSPEDKLHWNKLLPKLNPDQRERLHHSLIAKTEISRAITLVEKALNIISEAEAEAAEEVKLEDTKKSEKDQLLEELESIKNKEDEILFDEKQLRQRQLETKTQIEQIRNQLKKLSLEVHGEPPPSYAKQQVSIPQLKKR